MRSGTELLSCPMQRQTPKFLKMHDAIVAILPFNFPKRHITAENGVGQVREQAGGDSIAILTLLLVRYY